MSQKNMQVLLFPIVGVARRVGVSQPGKWAAGVDEDRP